MRSVKYLIDGDPSNAVNIPALVFSFLVFGEGKDGNKSWGAAPTQALIIR
jgi:hypothetical protein